MADTQEAPQVETDSTGPGSLWEAQAAILKMKEPEGDKPESEEATPTEVEESTEETQDDPVEEDPEEEAEEESEDEPEGTDERAAEGEDLYAVTVNGEEQQIPLDELLKGYSRQSDYTKKTQEVSEQRKQMASLKSHYEQEVSQIQTERQQYIEYLQNNIPQSADLSKFDNIDWAGLKDIDPLEYMNKREEFRDAKDKIQETQGVQREAMEKYQRDLQKTNTDTLQREHKLLVEKVPEWGKKVSQKKMAEQIRTYAVDQGFLKEELDSLADHRSIIVLQKAMKYDQLKASNPKAKKIKNAPRVIRAGSGSQKKDESRSNRAVKMKRLRNSGHVDDAASLLEDMFKS